MVINYNVSGADRKRLVTAIAEHLGEKAKYLGAPSFSYQVGCITVDKEGGLHLNDMADPDWIEAIKAKLSDSGFACLSESYDSPQPEPDMEDEGAQTTEFAGICISMPRSLFTEANLENLKAIVASKAGLIRKALGVSDLLIEVADHKISFPWFPTEYTADELNAYEQFVSKLCDMARNQKRVNAKEKDADNEKYAFRCFLLRLGFIGDDYKVARKILLRNFTGSSAFKSGPKAKEVE